MTRPATPEQAGPTASPAASPATASGTAGPATAERPASRRWSWLALVIPFLAELAVGGYQLGGASLWRDEGYTLEVASRPIGAILSMVPNEDAVHGFYYVIMHFVVTAAGTSAVALRLPSLLAMAVAAGLTGGLGRRLALESGLPAPSVTGMLAGLVLVMFPLTTWYAQDARPYAMTTLCVVAASWVLVHTGTDRRWRWYVLYAVLIVLIGLLNMFALLIVPAHAISLLLVRGPRSARSARPARPARGPSQRWAAGRWATELRWLAAVVAAGVVLSPYLVICASQAGSLGWVPRPTVGVVLGLIADFAGSKFLVPVTGVLVGIGIVAELNGRRGRGWTTANLAVPWLFLPPVALLLASLAYPAYVERYVVFCMPATALLAAAGLVRLARAVTSALPGGLRRARQVAWVAIVVVVVAVLAAVQAGPQRTARLTSSRPDNMREVARIVAARERPGDGVIYLPWDARVVGITYPAPFARLSDIGQKESPTASDTLRGTAVPVNVLVARLPTVRRVWMVQWRDDLKVPRVLRAEAKLLPRLRLIRRWKVQSVVLSLYQVLAS